MSEKTEPGQKPRQLTIDSVLNPNEEPEHVRQALELIKAFEPSAIQRHPDGYMVSYSGGKDSDVLVDLFIRSGVRFFVRHNHTTMDAPETVHHVRKNFARWEAMGIKCVTIMPKMNFWELSISRRMLPTRWRRFCCSYLKENDPPEYRHATHAFGVRKAESAKRANRDSIELSNNRNKQSEKFHFDNTEEVIQSGSCYTKRYFFVNPIAYWTDAQIWEYIEDRGIKTNPLYAEGYARVGCIGCPLANSKFRLQEFERYPSYFCRTYRAADEICRLRAEEGKTMHFPTAELLMRDWMGYSYMRADDRARL